VLANLACGVNEKHLAGKAGLRLALAVIAVLLNMTVLNESSSSYLPCFRSSTLLFSHLWLSVLCVNESVCASGLEQQLRQMPSIKLWS